MVVVNALHVVPKIPLTGEAVARNGTLAAFVHAEKGLIAVSVQTVSLTLMTEEAGGRREASPFARLCLATVRLQV
jgi:hypothetical protein